MKTAVRKTIPQYEHPPWLMVHAIDEREDTAYVPVFGNARSRHSRLCAPTSALARGTRKLRCQQASE